MPLSLCTRGRQCEHRAYECSARAERRVRSWSGVRRVRRNASCTRRLRQLVLCYRLTGRHCYWRSRKSVRCGCTCARESANDGFGWSSRVPARGSRWSRGMGPDRDAWGGRGGRPGRCAAYHSHSRCEERLFMAWRLHGAATSDAPSAAPPPTFWGPPHLSATQCIAPKRLRSPYRCSNSYGTRSPFPTVIHSTHGTYRCE